MQYIILSKGCPFGDGDSIWGYVTSKDLAIILCDKFNEQSKQYETDEDYYFIEADESSSLYFCIDCCLDYMINRT